jgi:hypothetical protein
VILSAILKSVTGIMESVSLPLNVLNVNLESLILLVMSQLLLLCSMILLSLRSVVNLKYPQSRYTTLITVLQVLKQSTQMTELNSMLYFVDQFLRIHKS